ncbi:hypothetical protein AB3464_28570 [Pseudomonas asplenii]|uniref:hypothetical protein n=1 Tax=Pseudomonas asplenii TaxID=53407 RepID=UPI0037C72E87
MNRAWARHLSAGAKAVIWLSALILLTGLFNLLAIQMLGNIQQWNTWLQEHATAFLIWRLGLYGVLSYGWCWMRARLLRRQPEASQRLRRAECAGIAALVLLEVSNALAAGSEAQ